MFLIAGLGNPGDKYVNNRHNVGFMAVDEICSFYDFSAEKTKFSGKISEGKIDGEKCITIKPETYMNLSGGAVRQACDFYKIPLEKVIVIHDELDIAVGKIKVKTGGGSGGHNGIKDIDRHIGQEYQRVRIGIDHPGNKHEVSNYVLKDFKKEERIVIDELNYLIAKHFSDLLNNDNANFINKITLKQ